MRKINKMFTLILSVVMLVSMNNTALAAESSDKTDDFALDGIIVTVTHEDGEFRNEVCNVLDCVGADATFAQSYAVETKELGTSDSVDLNWAVNSESNVRSQYNYTTNSEKIVVKMKGNLSTSVTLRLYNSAGTEVASSTATVGTLTNTTFTFSNLKASTVYYFKIYNNDQHNVTLTGTISAK